jgi:hypothetical protein
MATAGSRVVSADITSLETYSSERPMTLVRQSTTGQTINDNTTTVITFPTATATEEYDDLGWHNGTSNTSRITPTIAGRYHIRVHLTWAFNTTVTASSVNILKNGSVISASGNLKPNATDNLATFGGTLDWYADANGTTDYFEMSVAQQSTGNVSQTTNVSSSGYTWILVELHRAS